jgi:hypothetical protein
MYRWPSILIRECTAGVTEAVYMQSRRCTSVNHPGATVTYLAPTLLNTIVYLFGLHFALRGRDEHRRLRRSQLTIRTGQDGRRYLEYQEVSMPIANVHYYLPRIGEDIA